jgi:hypothetical protein
MKPEEQFARQICRALNQGTHDLDHSVTERLRAGRERALRQQTVTA